MADYIDDTYVDNMIGQDLRQALFTPKGGTYQSAAFDQQRRAAEAHVKALLEEQGYTPPDDLDDGPSTDDKRDLQALTFYTFLTLAAGGFRQWQVPQQYLDAMDALLKKIESRRFKSLTLTVRDATGGLKFSETSTSVTGNRAPVFGRNMGR